MNYALQPNKLKARLVEKQLTQQELANQLSLSLYATNYKINGAREFNASELLNLINVLEIKTIDELLYFFTK